MRVYPIQDRQIANPNFANLSNRISIRTMTILLDTLTNEKEIPCTGTFIWLYDSYALNSKISLRFNDLTSDKVDMTRGMRLSGIPFERIFASWTAQAGHWITLLYASEKEDDKIIVSDSILGFTSPIYNSPSYFTDVGDKTLPATTTSLLINSSSLRRELILSAPIINSEGVRIGGSTVSSTSGVYIHPGGSLILSSKGAVYAYNPAAVDNYISIAYTYD